MKITINQKEFRSVLYKDKFYDTQRILDVTFTEYIGLAQRYNIINHDYHKVKYNPEFWNKNKTFILQSDVDSVSGWGNVTMELLKNSQHLDPRWIGRRLGVGSGFLYKIQTKDIDPSMAIIYHEQPKDRWLSSIFSKNLAIVPFETTRVPFSWVSKLNYMDVIIVPCSQNVQMMKDSGVTVPIEIAHWGVNPYKFHPIKREDDGIFTFGTMGALSIRKGTDILTEAFKRAFPNEKDVRLIAKTSHRYYPFLDKKDKRIEVQMDAVPIEELMKDFYSKVDCFVFPTRGEGFGLPPLEAMLTGIPTIVTNWSGPKDYINSEIGYPLSYSMVPAKDFSENVYHENCGEWAEPNINELVQIMRHCYTHQDEVREKGKKASDYVLQNWLWGDKIKMFHKILNKYL